MTDPTAPVTIGALSTVSVVFSLISLGFALVAVLLGVWLGFRLHKRPLRRHPRMKIAILGAAVLALVAIICAPIFGWTSFTPVYSAGNTEEILPVQSTDNFGNPFVTIEAEYNLASFTTRDANGLISSYEVSTVRTNNPFTTHVSVWEILDDAEPGTAYITRENCTLVSESATAVDPACESRYRIHIPRITAP